MCNVFRNVMNVDDDEYFYYIVFNVYFCFGYLNKNNKLYHII